MNANKLITEAVRGDIPWRDCLNLTFDGEIYIVPQDIIKTLNKYLSKNISEKELQDWAGWVMSIDSLCVKGWESDSIADHYEPMWNCVQELSTPFLDGNISSCKVERYVSILKLL